jgi:hypothetical protein
VSGRDPLLTKTAGFKLRLRLVKTRAAGQREFDEFVPVVPARTSSSLEAPTSPGRFTSWRRRHDRATNTSPAAQG